MKILTRLTLISLMPLVASHASAQQPPTAPQPPVKQEQRLTRFDLDFAGGTPRELVLAIQRAMGRPLNAIVPDRYADHKFPPLKMKGVDVSELFNAMFKASQSQVMSTIGGMYQRQDSVSGFMSDGPRTDDSVWYFVESNPSSNQEFCRFYLLTPYLQAGLTVDDITTAIQTSWKMLGDVKPSKLSFHKETKLLIAVGLVNNLQIIDDVLKALSVQQKAAVPPSSPTNEAHPGK